MRETAKQRDVIQLLRDYRTYWSAHGGAMPIDDSTNVTEASYGPAGYIEAGMAFGSEDGFTKRDRYLLAKSYEYLEHALTLLKADGQDGMAGYLSLLKPYLSDPADPAVVERWRKSGSQAVTHHDHAVKKLAGYLRVRELHPIYGKMMSVTEEARVERQNAEMYAIFQRLRVSGFTERAAISQVAEQLRVGTDTVERVVEFRSELKLASCAEPNCTAKVFSQNLCQKHYQRQYRFKRKNAS